LQIQSFSHTGVRGDEQGRSCRHGRGEDHGREGSSPWVLLVAGGEGFQSRTSRTAAASRRRAGPAARESGTSLDEQGRSRTGGGESTTSWGRAGDELQSLDEQGRSRGGAGEKQRRSRTGGRSRSGGQAEEDRRRGRANGALSLLILPRSLLTLPRSLLVAARGPGGAGIPPALRFGAKIGHTRARAHLARLRAASAPAELAYAPPSAATRDYAPSRGDGLRPATRRT